MEKAVLSLHSESMSVRTENYSIGMLEQLIAVHAAAVATAIGEP